MTNETPNLIVLAGPNGAGKSTAAASVLQGTLQVMEFVNADVIARGLSAFDPERAAIPAGRIMLDRLKELASQRADFAFETTLASRSFAPWIAGLVKSGYRFQLLFFWLPDAQLSVERVARRVREGGHHVPAETIRRRYERGLTNFFSLYRPLADEWSVYNNAVDHGPTIIASGTRMQTLAVGDTTVWDLLRSRYER